MSAGAILTVRPVSAIASSRRFESGQTHSILTDPEGRWVARRQGAINAAFEKHLRVRSDPPAGLQPEPLQTSQDVDTSNEPDGTRRREGGPFSQSEPGEDTTLARHIGFF